MFAIYSAIMRVVIPVLGMGGSISVAEAEREVARYLSLVIQDDEARSICLEKVRYLLFKGEACASQFEVSHLSSVMKTLAAPKLFRRDCTLNSLPIQLGSLNWKQLLHVYYLELHEQKNGWTCGYWAAFNAAALNAFFDGRLDQNPDISLNELLSSYARQKYYGDEEAIKTVIIQIAAHIEAQKEKDPEKYLDVSPPVYGEDAENTHIRALAECFGIPNLHVLQMEDPKYRETGENRVPCEFTFNDIVRDATSTPSEAAYHSSMGAGENNRAVENNRIILDEIMTLIKNQYVSTHCRYAAHHFCCFFYNPTPHWYLVSVVKLPQVQPFFVILDSYNFTIADNSDSSVLLTYLYEKLLRPLQAISESQWALAQPASRKPSANIQELEAQTDSLLRSAQEIEIDEEDFSTHPRRAAVIETPVKVTLHN